MDLNEEQKQAVAGWVSEGSNLSEIQTRLLKDFGLTLTYMDVRFLVLDLGLEVKDRQVPTPPPQEDLKDAAVSEGDAGFEDDELPGGLGSGAVRVELDRIVKPGSVVSGTVCFSDGVTASWALDQLGRLALDAGKPGYSPKPEDIQSFQDELRKALEKRGF